MGAEKINFIRVKTLLFSMAYAVDNCSVRTRIDRTRCKALIKSDLPPVENMCKSTASGSVEPLQNKAFCSSRLQLSEPKQFAPLLFLHCATRAKKRQIYCRLGTPINREHTVPRRTGPGGSPWCKSDYAKRGCSLCWGCYCGRVRFNECADSQYRHENGRRQAEGSSGSFLPPFQGSPVWGFYPGFRLSAPP